MSQNQLSPEQARQVVKTSLSKITSPTAQVLSATEKQQLSKALGQATPVKTISAAEAQNFISRPAQDAMRNNMSRLVRSNIRATRSSDQLSATTILNPNTSPNPQGTTGYESRAIPMASLTAMHRFGLGPAYGEDADINQAGGPVNWLRNQTTQPRDFGSDYRSTSQLLDVYESRHPMGGFNNTSWAVFWNAYTDEWGKFMRDAVTTRQPFALAWSMFWFNHFGTIHQMDRLNMPSAKKGLLGTGFMKDVIFPNMFGKFDDLVYASFNNAAMIFHLDGETFAPNPNQNYAREILELHTVGNNPSNYPAGMPVYTTQTIQELSYIISGRIAALTPFMDGGVSYPRGTVRISRASHMHPGNARSATSFNYLNRGYNLTPFLPYTLAEYPLDAHFIQWHVADQQQRVIRMIANHPACARHIVKKIVKYFVSDQLDWGTMTTLTNHLVGVWNNTGGDLGAVARALVGYDNLLALNNNYLFHKFKNPQRWVIAALRSSNLFPRITGNTPVVLNDTQRNLLQTAIFEYLQKLNMRLGYAPDVRGYSQSNADWKTDSGMLQRMMIATEIGALIQGQESARSFYNRTVNTLRLQLSRSASILTWNANQHAALLMSEEFLRG